MFGWLMIASLSLHLAFNLYFIFRQILKIIKNLILKYFNYMNHFYDQRFNKLKDDDKIVE